DVPAAIRRVTLSSSPALSVSPARFVTLATEPAEAARPATMAPARLAPTPAAHAHVAPLSPDRYRLQVTIGGDTLEKLRCAQDMLGHAIPSGEEAAVLDRALTVLLRELAKTKFASTPNPRPSRGTKTGEPSAAVMRAVWVRDCGRCRFVGAGGHRCDERRFIEFHHLDPKALGDEATVDTIELRCRRHNDDEGQLWFGKRRRSGRLRSGQVNWVQNQFD
ncbi:MAG TPA: hypothetical protein VFK70_00030, partial [Vicinamibacteria bacterium]|nr:hypothetical protein [Vicinamibacteria bacterium]